MKLDGESMIIPVKDAAKHLGISIIACCAVLVCVMFLNFYFDILAIKDKIFDSSTMLFYQAQVSTAKIVCIITGGCLSLTSLIMLIFYIKYYIDVHKKELGILKALGYSNRTIAQHFWVFGISFFIGAGFGFLGALLIMPKFYELQNKDHILPEIIFHFHPSLLLFFVIIPAIVFAVFSIGYAAHRLRRSVLSLLKNLPAAKCHANPKVSPDIGKPFLYDIRKCTLRSRKILLFFILFASFCFSSMTQMAYSMKDLSSVMMGIMILCIGLILAFTTLYIAVTTVVSGNTQTIAMMRIFGYSQKQCCHAILGGYRLYGYIGFAAGSAYQYFLLKIMVTIVFRDIAEIPVYSFDVPVMLLSLITYIAGYELLMYLYREKIKKISIKTIMLES